MCGFPTSCLEIQLLALVGLDVMVYERCDRMMLVTRVMGMGGGGGDGLMGLVKVTVMTR